MALHCSLSSRGLWALGLVSSLGLGHPARAAQPSPQVGVEQKAQEPITAEQLATLRIAEGSILPSRPASIKAMNRKLVTLRVTAQGWSASTRADAAEARISAVLEQPGEKNVSLLDRNEGTAVLVNDVLMFGVLRQDTPEGTTQAAHQAAQEAATTLQRAIAEWRESRDPRSMSKSGGIALLATLVLALLLRLLYRARIRVQGWLEGRSEDHTKQFRLGGFALLSGERLVTGERLALGVLFWLLLLLMVYQWLGVSLDQFPYARVWAEQLNGFLFGLTTRFLLAAAGAVPDLFAATLIFALAVAVNRMLKRFFGNVALGLVKVQWLDADVAPVTARLCTVAVWIFALAMAYPYLPGSDTDAFKGLSVLVGLMISLGASSLVGQGASGLILIYSRAIRAGEFVQVAGYEGTVMSLGAFTMRIRTGMGEELTISNSQVLGSVTKNYSRNVDGIGFVVDTVVTIGYDTPWRQVEALLVQAALNTPGVVADPPPQVFQTALADFYPQYRLVCQAIPSEPRPRAVVMSMLHANIQDLFNEFGVQIMSPNYRGDPEHAKLVPPDQWYAPPAKPPARK